MEDWVTIRNLRERGYLIKRIASELKSTRNTVKRALRSQSSLHIIITSDGAHGVIKAIKAVFPLFLRIRCWFHRMQNVAAKVPPAVWLELKTEILQIRDASSYKQAEKLKRGSLRLIKGISQAILAHLKPPVQTERVKGTANLMSSFVERRRTKVIRVLYRRNCPKHVFSVLINATKWWRRVTMGQRT